MKKGSAPESGKGLSPARANDRHGDSRGQSGVQPEARASADETRATAESPGYSFLSDDPPQPARNLADFATLMEQLTAVLIAETGALAALDMSTVRLLAPRKKALADACAATAAMMQTDADGFRASSKDLDDPRLRERIEVLSRQFELALGDNARKLEGTIQASHTWLDNLVRQLREKRHPTTGYGPDGRPR